MKQFNNLLEAINFRTQCPLCQGKLHSNSYVNSNKKIAFNFLGSFNNTIYANIETQNIEFDFFDKKLLSHSGTLGLPVTIECDDCHMYSFIIQVWINLNNRSIIQILLNSERVSWEDSDLTLHEVVSVYSTDKTKYSFFNIDTSKDDGQIFLPFVPINFLNPKDTVERIKKLLIFL